MQLSNHSAAACRQHFLKRSEERPALAIQSPLPSNLRADVAHVGVVEVVRELANGFIVLYIRLANRRTKLINVLLLQDPKRPSFQVLLQDSMSPLETGKLMPLNRGQESMSPCLVMGLAWILSTWCRISCDQLSWKLLKDLAHVPQTGPVYAHVGLKGAPVPLLVTALL